VRPDPERVRLAAEALARARADAWARGDRPGKKSSSAERPGASADGSLPASWSARTRREDPQRLSVAVGGMLSARGWRARAAVGGVFGRWAEIVGEQVAAHVKPVAFEDGELVVDADSPAWATQMRLLAPQVLQRLGQALGPGTVRHVRVRGGATGGAGSRYRPRRRVLCSRLVSL
jgi:predicted nucleic acid-binding Zn ribbon protein